MSTFKSLLGKQIHFQISSWLELESGRLIDEGDDILVFSCKDRFFYVPVLHLHRLLIDPTDTEGNSGTRENPIDRSLDGRISYRKTLQNARGIYVELFLAGTQSMHGYMTGIMNDYLVFYSPLYDTVYVSLDHIKAIVPYSTDMAPYSMKTEHFAVKPANVTLARGFEQQLKKLEGRLIVLDLGDSPDKVGLLQAVDNGFLTLTTAIGTSVTWSIRHMKSVHIP